MDRLKECKKYHCGKCPDDEIYCNIEKAIFFNKFGIGRFNIFALDKDNRIYTKSKLEDNIYRALIDPCITGTP